MEITFIEAVVFMSLCIAIGFFMGRWARAEREHTLEDVIHSKDRHIKTMQAWMDATRKHKDV